MTRHFEDPGLVERIPTEQELANAREFDWTVWALDAVAAVFGVAGACAAFGLLAIWMVTR